MNEFSRTRKKPSPKSHKQALEGFRLGFFPPVTKKKPTSTQRVHIQCGSPCVLVGSACRENCETWYAALYICIYILCVCKRCFRTVRWKTFLFTFYFYFRVQSIYRPGNNIIYNIIHIQLKKCVSTALNSTLNIIRFHDGICI